MTRPIVLLPPSKGKAAGGGDPVYGDHLDVGHPLDEPRREVLKAAQAAADDVDDRGIARLTGVKVERVAEQRPVLAQLATAPTLPAHRRYTGVVHEHAGLMDVDPTTAGLDVRIVSALLGLATLDDPVPDYRLEVAASLPPLGGLGRFWREHLAEHLAELTEVPMWDLLPGEHAVVWPEDVRGDRQVRRVRFVRADGRAAPAARVKIAKGRLVAALLADPDLTPSGVAEHVDLGPTWTLAASATEVVATDDGDGRRS